jgi:hypothetical protein
VHQYYKNIVDAAIFNEKVDFKEFLSGQLGATKFIIKLRHERLHQSTVAEWATASDNVLSDVKVPGSNPGNPMNFSTSVWNLWQVDTGTRASGIPLTPNVVICALYIMCIIVL